MARLVDLLPLIGAQIEGCPQITVLAQLQWALREFTTKSNFLRESVYIDLIPGEMYYPLMPTIEDTQVFNIDAVQYRGCPLDPTGPKESYRRRNDELGASLSTSEGEDFDNGFCCDPETDLGGPSGYWFEPPATVVFDLPTPFGPEDTAAVSLLLRHKVNSTTIAEAIDREYRDAIAYGALYRLMLMPKKPWSEPQQAAIYREDFYREIANASSKASRQFRRRNFRVRAWA